MFRLLPKKKKISIPLLLCSIRTTQIRRIFCERDKGREKKAGGGGRGEGKGGEFDQGDSVGGGASHRATCECEHKSKLAAT